jgi:hypothetical protein
MSNDAGKSEAKASGEVTRFLERAQRGEPSAAAELRPLDYHELRRLAAHKLGAESLNHTHQRQMGTSRGDQTILREFTVELRTNRRMARTLSPIDCG